MARTESNMLPLGTALPEFSLPEVTSQKTIRSADFAGKKGLLVMFICRHCPYVKHVQQELVRLANEYVQKGFAVLAISSNDAENYPDDRPESLAEQAREMHFQFPYCYDETQAIAKAFQAACTPDLYVFDAQQKLAYRGQFDNSRPKTDAPVTGSDLRAALESVLNGQPVSADQKPSLGCNIKWKNS